MNNLKIAIVGGGIGGIATAIGLVRQGFEAFDVFEGARCFGEIGAGLNFAPNARSAIAKLGLEKEFNDLGTFIADGYYFEYRLGTSADHHLVATAMSAPAPCSTVHRAKFLSAMLDHVPKDRVHFGKRLDRLERLPSETPYPVRLHFQDGTTHDAHLVIGCDGIHSKMREYVNVTGAPRWSGTWAYRALVPIGVFAEAISSERRERYCRVPQMFMDKDRHILTFPIDHHKTINVVAFYTDRTTNRPCLVEGEAWTQTTSQQDLLSKFEGWDEDMVNVFKCFEKPTKWALHQIDPLLPTYIGDHVLLLGDAAHGGVPHQGALAGQAFEDALFLSRILSHPGVNAGNLMQVLPVYDLIRLPRANRVLQTSLEAGDAYEFAGPDGDDLCALANNLSSRWAWIWEHDHDEDIKRALEWLKGKGILQE